MVFHGANLDPMLAAADANDQTLTPDVIDARGGEQLVTYAQCALAPLQQLPEAC